jgi:hypothetical protein
VPDLLLSSGTSDIVDMGIRTHSWVVIPLLLIWPSLSAWGQQTSKNVVSRLAMPEWLAPFSQARDQSATSASTENISTYTALAHPAEVISHYERQMRAAGVAFKTQSDGIGVSILASAERLSAVVRIREAEDVSRVKVTYSVAQDKPAGQSPAIPRSQTAVPQQSAPISPARRAPTSPWARAPYTWIMQSVLLPGSRPPKYSALYYEAPTDATVEKPLPLPAGATIVDVFSDTCMFSLQDQAGHSVTFKSPAEARGQVLAPGTWSVYPIKCSGVAVFLR